MSIHKDLIVIDSTTNLISLNKNPKYIGWYQEGGATAVVLTVSTSGMTASSNSKEKNQTLDILGAVHRMLQTRDDLILVQSTDDIHEAKKTGKLGVILQFQGTVPIENNLDLVNLWKGAGVNVIQLAYNVRNQFANGVFEPSDDGLSKLGVDLVKRLNEARIIIDVSHTGVKTSLHAIEVSTAPVVATHANPRGLYGVLRNIPDELIKAIAAKGGLCGAVMYPPFVREEPRPTMDDYIAHIDYMVQLVGVDHVAIASDYMEGQSGLIPDEVVSMMYDIQIASGAWSAEEYPPPPYVYPEGIETPKTLYNLTDALLSRGYSEDDVRKIWGGNWQRVMKQVWG